MLAWTRRAAAAAVALLCFLPLHRLLSRERNGPAAVDALERAEPLWSMQFWGAVLIVLVGVVGALVVQRLRRDVDDGSATGGAAATDAPARRSLGDRIARALLRPTRTAFALGVAALSAALTVAVTLVLQLGLLTGVDEMAAVIQARYLAAGMLGGTLPSPTEAWLVPNTLVTGAGWVSQYPPGHLLAWAAFLLVGVGWAVGPALFAVTAGLLAASFERLLPAERQVQARVAALLVAASPFLVILAGASTSHVTAGAAGALALYTALRAAEGRLAWALASGAAVGMMVLARPWTGLVLGPTLTLGVWLERGGATLARRAVLPWILGGVPFALLLFAYDSTLFGSPLTLGYEALYGPAHGLGFHADPWSFGYGVREAIAYTSSNLIQLGALLLETPVSLVLVGALWLALVPRLPSGTRTLAAWALIPVFAQALYWFHAPRMLSEAAPAWILLAVLAVSHALTRADRVVRAGVWSGMVATGLVAGVALVPSRIRSQAWPEETLSRITVPDSAAAGALVFVHAAWDERLASMLQATGMRNDSIQPIVRRNDLCALRDYAIARLEGVAPASLPPIDLEQAPAPIDGLISLQQPGGSVVWRKADVDWSLECVREMNADRYGSVALVPLLWQGDLPGLERGGPMFVRDFGPERNEAVRALFPSRPSFVWAHPPGGRPALIPYEAAMGAFWGDPSSAPPPPVPPGRVGVPD